MNKYKHISITDFPRLIKNKLKGSKRYFSNVEFKTPSYAVFDVAYEEIFKKENYLFNADSNTPLIIDCGANIGLSVAYFKTIYPQSKIIAYEADKIIFDMLKSNIHMLKYADVDLRNQAVWIEDTKLDFVSEGGLSGKILKVDDPENDSITRVDAIDFANILVQQVDFLKIDIEGAEVELIKHISPQLSMVKNMFIEYHSYSSQDQNLSALLHILEQNKFRYQIKEVFTVDKPYMSGKEFLKERIFDLQLEIFAYRTSL
jgi:FkbM family methyltransferase